MKTGSEAELRGGRGRSAPSLLLRRQLLVDYHDLAAIRRDLCLVTPRAALLAGRWSGRGAAEMSRACIAATRTRQADTGPTAAWAHSGP